MLFTFEAAARRRSFTAAAAELNVSQPAVSRMIRQLETALGPRLFHRVRPLELTAEGKRLFAEVERSFDQLDATIRAMRRVPRRDTVKAAFSASFLRLWPLPRLGEFHERFPGIGLALEESSQDDLDVHAEGVEVSTSLGHGFALGWSHLVLDYILKGDLQQVGPRRLATGKSVWLICPRKRPPTPAAFVGWLAARMAAGRAAHPAIFLPA